MIDGMVKGAGGVIFIDEVYQLYDSKGQEENDATFLFFKKGMGKEGGKKVFFCHYF